MTFTSLHLAILTLFLRIVRYKVRIAWYKVRIVRYKVRIDKPCVIFLKFRLPLRNWPRTTDDNWSFWLTLAHFFLCLINEQQKVHFHVQRAINSITTLTYFIPGQNSSGYYNSFLLCNYHWAVLGIIWVD